MNRFLFLLLGITCCLTVMAANPGGGGSSIARDTCIAVSHTGECYSFINGKHPQRLDNRIKASQSPAKAPHHVGYTTYDKLYYSIFDFDEGNGYVATLIGWVDPNDYYPDIVVPNTVQYNGQDVPVTGINVKAFFGGWGIKSVKFGENVGAIFDFAFYSCSLTELNIPLSVQLIFQGAFMYNLLKSVKFEKPNKQNPTLYIGLFAFAGLEIKDFEIPARLDPYPYLLTARSNPLAQNRYLSSISINPATGSWGTPSRTSDGDGEYCSFEIINDALCVATGTGDNRRVTIVAYPAGNTKENFELSENLINVNDDAFDLSRLFSIKLKAISTSDFQSPKIAIFGNAFIGSHNLKNLSIDAQGDIELSPKMVTDCENLEEVHLGSGITNYTVTDKVIYQTIEGEKTLICYPAGKTDDVFTIPNGVTAIDSFAFSQNQIIRKVVMPSGLKKIGSYAFLNCLRLSSVELPGTLEQISNNAFESCNLNEITIPESIKIIDSDAFYTNPVVSKVTVLCKTPPLSSDGEVATTIFNPQTLESATLTIPDNIDFTTFTSHPAWAFKNVQYTGINDVLIDANAGFYIDNRTIISNGNYAIELYNINGTIIGSGVTVTAPTSGIYIVRQGYSTYKISLR